MGNLPFVERTGFMFVLSSPSGAGKTTISRFLLEKDHNLEMSVSVTTRPKRPNEKDGVDYYFVSEEKFSQMITNHEFLEHAKVFGNFYGTPEEKVRTSLAKGRDVIFDIDWQGTRQLAEKARQDLVSVFILPPSMGELEKRLRKRGQDKEEVLQERMKKANMEISHWDEYDYVIVNNNLEESIDKVVSILRAERLKRIRQGGLENFVRKLLK